MIKRLTAAATLVALTLSSGGCIGSMAVTAKLREFNMGVSPEPWPREGVFLLLYCFGAYPIAGMADVLVVNSIEFWTGTNPVSNQAAKVTVARVGQIHREVSSDGTVARSTLLEDGTIDIEITAPDGTETFLNVANTGEALVARDAQGRESARVLLDQEFTPPVAE